MPPATSQNLTPPPLFRLIEIGWKETGWKEIGKKMGLWLFRWIEKRERREVG